MVIREGVPWPVYHKRAGGLTGIGIAQIRRDATVFSLELVDGVKGVCQGRYR
jgi:hypothetical protein